MTMKVALVLLVALSAPTQAQVRATTSDGRVVVLYSDGTWKPDQLSAVAKPLVSTRPAKATEKLDILRGKATVYYDPAAWQITKSDDPNRITLAHANGDGYAMLIAERLEMSMDALRRMALKNAQAAAPNASIIGERNRLVNGKNVLELEIRGTLDGVDFAYLGYYYSSTAGTIQFITYTSSNLIAEYRPTFQELLNGLVVP